MIIILTIFLFSFILNSLVYIPFINLLYKLKFQRKQQYTRDVFEKPTPIFDELHKQKAGTPVGGGVLIITTTAIFFPIMLILMKFFFIPLTADFPLFDEAKILIFTFISFGLLGLLDDAKKTFDWAKGGFFGLRLRHKLAIQVFLALIIATWMSVDLKIKILHVPFLGVYQLNWLFVPFAAFVIVAFSNAFNITDGLDGLSGGVLLISLMAFLVISSSVLDAPMSVFIALWMGALVGFLYFNVYPARILMGDVGALSFGATFAVIGLMLGKSFALMIIGGIFVIEVMSSLVQLISKKYRGKKVMSVAPLHLWLQYRGWPEPKVVMRLWLTSVVLAVFGLWLALLTN